MPQKKTKIYVAVMLLGGAALLVDRCFLSESVTEPGPAYAMPTKRTPARDTTQTPVAAPGGPADLSVPELPFPRNLPKWDTGAPIRDLFSPMTNAAADNALSSGRDGNPGPGTCAAFARGRSLDAVFVQGTAEGTSLKIAVVDGRWVRIGQALDGCTLIEADGTKVRFRCRDGEVSLSVKAGGEVGDR